MSEQYVSIIDTKTSKIIEIREPGSQQENKKIHCSRLEAIEIIRQLEELLVHEYRTHRE